MSQAIIELHERSFAAVNAREFSDELAEELLAPEFRMESVSTAVTDKTYHGADGIREWIRGFFEASDDGATLEIEEVLADGEDFVVVMARLSGHGARSQAPLVLRRPSVTWFENGRQTRTVGYAHRREALEAVGLAQ